MIFIWGPPFTLYLTWCHHMHLMFKPCGPIITAETIFCVFLMHIYQPEWHFAFCPAMDILVIHKCPAHMLLFL